LKALADLTQPMTSHTVTHKHWRTIM